MANDYGFFLFGIPIDTSMKPYLVTGNIPTQFLTPITHNFFIEYGPLLVCFGIGALLFVFVYPIVLRQYGTKSC